MAKTGEDQLEGSRRKTGGSGPMSSYATPYGDGIQRVWEVANRANRPKSGVDCEFHTLY